MSIPNLISRRSTLFLLLITTWASATSFPSAEAGAKGPKQLLIRCDDIGMSHTVNMAVRELIETGMPFSASVMITPAARCCGVSGSWWRSSNCAYPMMLVSG